MKLLLLSLYWQTDCTDTGFCAFMHVCHVCLVIFSPPNPPKRWCIFELKGWEPALTLTVPPELTPRTSPASVPAARPQIHHVSLEFSVPVTPTQTFLTCFGLPRPLRWPWNPDLYILAIPLWLSRLFSIPVWNHQFVISRHIFLAGSLTSRCLNAVYGPWGQCPT